MEIQGKRVLVLGAAGMVGQAICRELIREGPHTLVLYSLHEYEVTLLAESLAKEFEGKLPELKLAWGNFLVRHEWKDLSRQELLSDSKIRHQLILDCIEPLTKETLTASEIYYLCTHYQPDCIIDAVNFATTLPYSDLYGASKEALNAMKRGVAEQHLDESATQAIEKLLLAQHTPQITKHVQILFQSMVEAKTKMYLKVGTLGSLGMELRIPYTHSKNNPPQDLLAKTALAGAHSLLLLMMSKTPGGPTVKELKPSTAIAWKQIGFGPIAHRGRAILMEDVGMQEAVSLVGKLGKGILRKPKYLRHNGEPMALTAPFIDLGENSLFSMGEFEFLTGEGQIGFITPEEVAHAAIREIRGEETGSDVIAAMEAATMKPTYRAGRLREEALKKMRELVQKTGVESVAFELLGPPRLSKILYEAHLLKLTYGTCKAVLATEAGEISKTLEKYLMEKTELRSQIVSIGIPILLSKGDKLLRGSRISVPTEMPGKPDAQFEISELSINQWAHDGWVDLRPTNMVRWQERLQKIDNGRDQPIEISKLASQIFS